MVLIKSEIKDEEMIFERYSICCFAGIFITLQGTFNAKLSSHIGIWSTSIITHLIGFIIATTVFLLKKEEKVTDLKSVKIYLVAGAFGGFIICAETMAIYSLGVTLTAGTLMVAQLLTATVIEMKGLFHIKRYRWRDIILWEQ